MSLESVKNIVLILSGKGGVGKSSITTQLALSLSLAGKSVGILDIDLTGPSIPRFLGLEDAKIKQAPGGWLPVEVHKAQVLPPISTPNPELPTAEDQNGSAAQGDDASHGHNTSNATTTITTNGASLPPRPPHFSNPPPANAIHAIAPPITEHFPPTIGALHAISLAFLLPTRSSAVIWRGPKKTAMVRQFLTDVLWPSSGIDYLLIDTPPGTSDEHISLAETLLTVTTSSSSNKNNSPDPNIQQPPKPRLAGAVIVTTPQAVAISDVRKEINFCKKTGIAVLGVVENMAGFVCECCGEETDLFGRGGGEEMAREFGVRFLGRVAMDPLWGRLVEEGKRPRYGELRRGGSGDDGAELAEMDEGGLVDEQEGKEEGSLVDKYRSCKLCETFEGIARRVIGIVEGQAD